MTETILRTPESRFTGLPDYPFAPNYHQVTDALRLHYVDVGPHDAAPVLMLHGEPTWSYLYRHVIPPVAAAGHRVLAPDLIGFGKSDKPARREAHTFAGQVAWIRHWMEALDLRDITLVCQDWGSLIGLRLAAESPERFARIIMGNGGLPTGDTPISLAFRVWQTFARLSPWFPIGRIVQGGTKRRLTRAERAAYDAPFPSAAYKAAARVYPMLVPLTPDNPASEANRKAWQVLERWEKPFICCYSDGDPITRGFDGMFLSRVPGTRDQAHITLHGGHFMQEDDPARLADLVIATCATDAVTREEAGATHVHTRADCLGGFATDDRNTTGREGEAMFTVKQCVGASKLIAALALVVMALLPGASLAQPAGIDPQAVKLLKASTDFLASQKQFTVDTRSSLEVVLVSGQKIQFDQTARQSVLRPNKLRADRTGDLVEQAFYYDGKTLTLQNPGEKRYATVAVPGTIEEMLDFARTKLDVVAPAGDLVYKDAYEILMADVTSGFVVGKGLIEGVRCDHLAFRTSQVDWQIWIQEGAQPLPRKFVITTRDMAGAPQFSTVITKWNLKPSFTPATFHFSPTSGMKKVDFMTAAQ